MIGWESSEEAEKFDLRQTLKKIIIGAIFIGMMPTLLLTATDIDISKACVVEVSVDPDTDVKTTECKDYDIKDDFIKKLLLDIQSYMALGIGLVMLAVGLGMAVGPGISLFRHELGCTRHI